ncbi:MAG: HIT family protein [Proteobacteria bacterium]|nr:HIT family protein [Pseudomonadota bacterium]
MPEPDGVTFRLDPRLAADTLPVLDLALCSVRLMNDARYPWLVLVPRRAGAVEIHALEAADRAVLAEETARVAAALERHAPGHKINIGALGNIVRQLHVHVVARREGDAAWPGPVWGKGAAVPYQAAEADRIVAALGRLLA